MWGEQDTLRGHRRGWQVTGFLFGPHHEGPPVPETKTAIFWWGVEGVFKTMLVISRRQNKQIGLLPPHTPPPTASSIREGTPSCLFWGGISTWPHQKVLIIKFKDTYKTFP